MNKQRSPASSGSRDFHHLSASFASDCKIQPRHVGKERIGLYALGEDESDDQPVWKEQAFDPEDLEGVMKYLRQAIKDNDALLRQAAEVLRPGVPYQDIIDLADAICVELKLAQENSPYPEVRACVDPFDDPTIPVLTFRMWVIGIFLVCLGTGVNQFFAQRMPTIGLSVTSAQLVAYPIGCMMAKYLPEKVFRIGNHPFTLNPGPFNMKEHMLISIMANVSFGGAFATDIIAVLRIKRFFNNSALAEKIGFQLTLVLSSQLIGYTLAGMTRKFLVYPPAMVWWGNLSEISVLRALHSTDKNQSVNGWRISRLRFFFIYSWTTWIAPHNVKLSLITGTVSGLGLNPVPTLDWSFMALDPIIIPLWSIVGFEALINVYAGACGGFLAICAIYFKNIRSTSYLPINTWGVFDRYGAPYNTSMVLDGSGILDQARYEAYSPPYMSASGIVWVTHEKLFAILASYTAFFALYSSNVVHAALYYRRYIMSGFSHLFSSFQVSYLFKKLKRTSGEKLPKSNIQEDTMYSDVHCRLMQAYPEVPEWWFMLVGVVSIMMAIFMLKYYESEMPTMPIWGLAFSFAIALVLIVPIGIMSAVASVSATLNVLSELVAGYALVGRPLGLMLCKTYGYITTAQAIGYASDMKIPPKALFVAQLSGTVLSSLISIAVLDWQIANIPDLCSPTQSLHFTCPGLDAFFSSSVLWGVVGSRRMFTGPDAPYRFCMYGFLIGAIAPVIPWIFSKIWPRSSWRLVHTPVIFSGFLCYGILNLGYYTPAIPLALFFQRYVKKRCAAWYEIEKYALTLTAGISSGVAIFGLFYFFALQFNGQNYPWRDAMVQRALCGVYHERASDPHLGINRIRQPSLQVSGGNIM
ncbi:putative oligopeptide transporter [Melampsora larici-populina 98AG31]|uniref:Putative oligopeptide transporter n=1 Tax=Melampsora larici-populina (strain 98AG31 / pathotype 3-4-7) TaxID=747676 RepID=F4RAG2_MELLP|nr:putative oligopeptide transporter [Melampsora larici-populina 98AG31]EGG10787.1 putative oligopeptide transporter [Melampsora larici-populina 98AG31]